MRVIDDRSAAGHGSVEVTSPFHTEISSKSTGKTFSIHQFTSQRQQKRTLDALQPELLLAWILYKSSSPLGGSTSPETLRWTVAAATSNGHTGLHTKSISASSILSDSGIQRTIADTLDSISQCLTLGSGTPGSPLLRIMLGRGGEPKDGPRPPCDETLDTIDITLDDNSLHVDSHEETPLDQQSLEDELESFLHFLNEICQNPQKLVGELHNLNTRDLKQLWQWNQRVPDLLTTCMHDIISDQSGRQPEALAVQSWDGNLTYAQVDEYSSRLAHHLCSLLGIGDGTGVESTRIPLCFEKSKWAVVALLGVMKAGATFSLTDPSQPEARLRTIVEQTGAKLIVTSSRQQQLGRLISSPNGQVLAVCQDLFSDVESPATWSSQTLPLVPPSAPMYIIFTSGSTGKPKGVVISHENYTSGAIPRAEAVGYKQHSRVFDFPSYAFDVSIDCMLCTLAMGGCVCVPSEEERMNDLSGAIRRSEANMVHMTPSVARVLDQDIIPSLDVLGLGGEAVSASDAAAWSKTTSLVIAYGPSECTVGCTINNTVNISTGIGRGVGGLTWIVDPDDHERLVPVGTAGELLVEGPVVGIGYLDEPEKTAQVFIENPRWLMAGCGPIPGRRGRLYKTGDLVRYEANGSGSIEFVGRKDQQVKLRGQRVELAEVEHHVQSCIPVGIQAAAEVIKPENGVPTLMAFLSESSPKGTPQTEDSTWIEPSPQLASVLASIETTLAERIPRYMIPAAFITLREIPSLVSGKVDRKKLREIGISVPREKLQRRPEAEAAEEEPEGDDEKALQRAWLRVLGSGARVYRQSSFFGLGGDSLRAMKLVASARDQGLNLTVADVFTSPTLKDMAANAVRSSPSETEPDIPPFSLLDHDWTQESARHEVAALCSIEASEVEDVYPCTPLQEALMALSAKVPEAYVAQRVIQLKDSKEGERLLSAIDTAQKDCPILRTRIVQVPGRGLMQVIVNRPFSWGAAVDLDGFLRLDRDDPMDLGKPLVRYAIVQDGTNGQPSFVLTMHHALYDGWSMPLVVERINNAYTERQCSRPSTFKSFIKYLKQLKAADSESYWRERLDGANGPQFPTLPHQGYRTKANSLLEEYVPLEAVSSTNTTVATIIRAAWAVVASQYISVRDIVFGETLTGRNAPVVGAEEIEGPMITTVPFRVHLDEDAEVSEFLQSIQELTVSQIPHEHHGLQHIRRLSPDALEACELRTGLVLHPSTTSEGDEEAASAEKLPASRLVPAGDAEAAQEALKFNTYALMLVCSIDPKGFLIMASFDSHCVGVPIMQRVLKHVRRVCQQMVKNKSSTRIRDLTCLEGDDIEDIRKAYENVKLDEVLQSYNGASAAYVVDSNSPDRCVPVGARGELLVRSSKKLDLPIFTLPSWLRQACPRQESLGNIYKTGKLATMRDDGHIHLSTAAAPATEITAKKRHQEQQRGISTPNARITQKLKTLWSRVLKMPEAEISTSDSFFLLGGDSISAMKLVSEARFEGLSLTVVQIFDNKTLSSMAGIVEVVDSKPEVQELTYEPFSLISDVENSKEQSFLEAVVKPQLASPEWNVTDVYPARPLQQIAVKGTTQTPRYSARYELMYLDSAVDRRRLEDACHKVVQRNEILRTVFVRHGDQTYGTVIEQLKASFVEYNVDDSDVEPFCKQLCALDVMTSMPLGSCFVKWFLVRSSSSSGKSCLILRISHAQYDEICLPLILRQFEDLYHHPAAAAAAQETIPFSRYVGHVIRKNVPQSLDYWEKLLEGSSMTVIRPYIPIHDTRHFAVQKALNISSWSKDLTLATLPTAAWSLCLAKRLGVLDVTFGEVVSGRNIGFPGADTVVGPCWQYIPVRVTFSPSWSGRDLLAHVQKQHVASSAHEGIALPEIVKQCTDWPSSTEWFDTVVHQDVAHVESVGLGGVAGRMETIYPHEEPLREWKIQAFFEEDTLTLEIVTVQSWGGFAEQLLEDLVDAAGLLVREPQRILFEE